MMIRNAIGNPAKHMAADVIQGQKFTHRLVAAVEKGIQTITLRDLNTREIVARHTAEKGNPIGRDAIHHWVEDSLKALHA